MSTTVSGIEHRRRIQSIVREQFAQRRNPNITFTRDSDGNSTFYVIPQGSESLNQRQKKEQELKINVLRNVPVPNKNDQKTNAKYLQDILNRTQQSTFAIPTPTPSTYAPVPTPPRTPSSVWVPTPPRTASVSIPTAPTLSSSVSIPTPPRTPSVSIPPLPTPAAVVATPVSVGSIPVLEPQIYPPPPPLSNIAETGARQKETAAEVFNNFIKKLEDKKRVMEEQKEVDITELRYDLASFVIGGLIQISELEPKNEWTVEKETMTIKILKEWNDLLDRGWLLLDSQRNEFENTLSLIQQNRKTFLSKTDRFIDDFVDRNALLLAFRLTSELKAQTQKEGEWTRLDDEIVLNILKKWSELEDIDFLTRKEELESGLKDILTTMSLIRNSLPATADRSRDLDNVLDKFIDRMNAQEKREMEQKRKAIEETEEKETRKNEEQIGEFASILENKDVTDDIKAKTTQQFISVILQMLERLIGFLYWNDFNEEKLGAILELIQYVLEEKFLSQQLDYLLKLQEQLLTIQNKRLNSKEDIRYDITEELKRIVEEIQTEITKINQTDKFNIKKEVVDEKTQMLQQAIEQKLLQNREVIVVEDSDDEDDSDEKETATMPPLERLDDPEQRTETKEQQSKRFAAPKARQCAWPNMEDLKELLPQYTSSQEKTEFEQVNWTNEFALQYIALFVWVRKMRLFIDNVILWNSIVDSDRKPSSTNLFSLLIRPEDIICIQTYLNELKKINKNVSTVLNMKRINGPDVFIPVQTALSMYQAAKEYHENSTGVVNKPKDGFDSMETDLIGSWIPEQIKFYTHSRLRSERKWNPEPVLPPYRLYNVRFPFFWPWILNDDVSDEYGKSEEKIETVNTYAWQLFTKRVNRIWNRMTQEDLFPMRHSDCVLTKVSSSNTEQKEQKEEEEQKERRNNPIMQPVSVSDHQRIQNLLAFTKTNRKEMPYEFRWYVDGKLRLMEWLMHQYFFPNHPRKQKLTWFRTESSNDEGDNENPYNNYYFRYYLPMKPDVETNAYNNKNQMVFKPNVQKISHPRTLLEKIKQLTQVKKNVKWVEQESKELKKLKEQLKKLQDKRDGFQKDINSTQKSLLNTNSAPKREELNQKLVLLQSQKANSENEINSLEKQIENETKQFQIQFAKEIGSQSWGFLWKDWRNLAYFQFLKERKLNQNMTSREWMGKDERPVYWQSVCMISDTNKAKALTVLDVVMVKLLFARTCIEDNKKNLSLPSYFNPNQFVLQEDTPVTFGISKCEDSTKSLEILTKNIKEVK